MKEKKQLVVLTQGCEEILRAVHFYRYMTARDVAELLYTPSSLRKVRALLSSLCGEGDFNADAYLYRFRMPKAEAGNPERIYALGRRGREFVEQELGTRVNWHVGPEKGRHVGFSQLMHNLILTKVLVAGRRRVAEKTELRLSQVRICYELGGEVTDGDAKGKKEVSVIPDAWMLFEKMKKGGREASFPVLLEIDRGTMYRQRFKKHVGDRIEFVRSGAYQRVFGIEAVVIAYVSTGAGGESREGRRKALAAWTQELLREQGRQSWASVFRFCSVEYAKIFESGMFGERVWYMPDGKDPVGLFT